MTKAHHQLHTQQENPSFNSGEDFLKTEYTLLNEWAIHGENVAHRIFNFYITLLTGILGGLLIVLQLLASNIQTSLIFVGGACAFLLFLGIIFFDALVAQNIQNAYYHAGMLSIRRYFQRYQEPALSLLKYPSFGSDFDSENRFDSTFSQLTTIKIGLPAGNQMSLIAGINSILLGTIIVSFVWGAVGTNYHPTRTLLVAAFCVFLSAFTHSRLAKIMINRNLTQIDGQLPQNDTQSYTL